jgi:hypothetical protein
MKLKYLLFLPLFIASSQAEVPTISETADLTALFKVSSNDAAEWRPLVETIVSIFNPLDKAAVARHILYPVSIKYPLEIRNEAELLEHWDLVFDDELVSKIANSKISDWSKVGWRGVMLENGVVWLDEESKKIITTNYTTKKGQQVFDEFTADIKKTLHPSVSEYRKNKMDLVSAKYRLRMDWLDDKVLRFALWESGQDISSKPQVFIESEEWRYDGSCAYFYATFRKDGLKYEYTPDGKHQQMLSIYRGEELLYQKEFESHRHYNLSN